MKNHTKVYLKHFGYDISSWIPCECCGQEAVDIHHIEARKMGGDKTGEKDNIENLMALCRSCHEKYGDKKPHKEYLTETHRQTLETNINLIT